jgi:hypothetical protein
MKAVFFSVLALATTALASPIKARNITDVVKTVGTAVETVPVVGDVVAGVVDGVKLPVKRADLPLPVDANSLIAFLTGAADSVKTPTAAIQTILDQVTSGAITPDAGEELASPQIQAIELELSQIVEDLTTAAGIDVPAEQVDVVLDLVVLLVGQLLTNVRAIVTILGLRPQLIVLLNSVFVLLAKILVLLNGIVLGLLPGLVAALSPLLAGLGNGLLAPIVTPVVALVAALAAGLPLPAGLPL